MSLSRNLVIGIDPFNGPNATYSWEAVEDGNSDGQMITCAFCPPPAKYGILGTRQECVFLGVSGCDFVVKSFDASKSQDNDNVITAMAITNRIDPTQALGSPPDAKRYVSLSFQNVNPLSKGLDVDYAKESEDPIEDVVTWDEFHWDTGSSRISFPRGLAQWIHLRIKDLTVYANRVVFGSFVVNFYNLFGREQEDT
jgi:hypothetical protein